MKEQIKPGFTAIEIVIGIMLSAILLTTSLTIYNQISKICNKIQRTTTQDLAVAIVQQRIAQDVQGLCPLWFTKEDLKDTTQTKKDVAQKTNIKNNNYFYAQTKDDQLDFMTFVSTNTLEAYPTPEHYIARIVYILKKDDKKENFFLLQRKEETQISDEFNIEKIKEGKFYTVTNNIKKCVLEYGFIEQSDEKNTTQEFKIKWVKQWSEKEEQENKDSKNKHPSFPEIIKITITLQELPHQPEVLHTFYATLPQSKDISLPSIAKKRIKEKSTQQQNNLSSANNIMNRIQNAAQQNAKGPTYA